MTSVESYSTTRSDPLHRMVGFVRIGAEATCAALVLAITAAVVVFPRPAAAGDLSALKAEAAQVSQSVIEEELQVGGYEHQYYVDSQMLQRDNAAIDDTQREIDLNQSRIDTSRAHLRDLALSAYTSAQSDIGGLGVFDSDVKNAVVRSAYQQLATSAVSTAVDQLDIMQSSLNAQEAVLHRQEAQDQATTAQAGELAQQARVTEAEFQRHEALINGQLAEAVTQERAAEARAASTARSATLVSDPALNGFLRCVLQAESGGNYGAVSPGGTYMGAFQFSQATWNDAAVLAGMPWLVGVPPNQATPAEQNALAEALYRADGEQPWYDPCRN